MSTYKDGDVYRYTPERTWCREGLATPTSDGLGLLDTYWQGGQETHRLTGEELATAEFSFNTNDYRELGRYDSWDDYPEEDKRVLTAQHGYSRTRYLRIGAEPSRAVIEANLREAVEESLVKVDSAQWSLERAQRQLRDFLAEDSVSGVTS